MLIYGYCLLQGANLLSDGSEMLLEILDPGLIGGAPCCLFARPSVLAEVLPTPKGAIVLGSTCAVTASWRRFACIPQACEAVAMLAGLVLPVLGALPDALIIVVSGLGGSAEEAQEQVCLHCAPHVLV